MHVALVRRADALTLPERLGEGLGRTPGDRRRRRGARDSARGYCAEIVASLRVSRLYTPANAATEGPCWHCSARSPQTFRRLFPDARCPQKRPPKRGGVSNVRPVLNSSTLVSLTSGCGRRWLGACVRKSLPAARCRKRIENLRVPDCKGLPDDVYRLLHYSFADIVKMRRCIDRADAHIDASWKLSMNREQC